MSLLTRLKRVLRREGFWGTAKRALEVTVIPVVSRAWDRTVFLQDKLFDLRYGVNTKAGVYGIRAGQLDLTGPNASWSTSYSPTRKKIFVDMLRRVSLEPEQLEFVDFGSGMGKAVLLAAMLPFRKVVGVELSEQLCQVARENVKRFRGPRRCGEIQILSMDATKFELAPVPTLLYMFNPFHEPVMRLVLENVVRSLEEAPRDFIILYYHQHFGHLFAEHPLFLTVAITPEYAIYRFRPAPKGAPSAGSF